MKAHCTTFLHWNNKFAQWFCYILVVRVCLFDCRLAPLFHEFFWEIIVKCITLFIIFTPFLCPAGLGAIFSVVLTERFVPVSSLSIVSFAPKYISGFLFGFYCTYSINFRTHKCHQDYINYVGDEMRKRELPKDISSRSRSRSRNVYRTKELKW